MGNFVTTEVWTGSFNRPPPPKKNQQKKKHEDTVVTNVQRHCIYIYIYIYKSTHWVK